MIKFFRKIRKKLLTENKVSKYFLYAIGEIVLVVIGILIALQINNWNQEKIAKQKEIKSLTELKFNLKKNVEQFNLFSISQNGIIDNMSKLIEYNKMNLPYHDSINVLFRGIGFLEQINLVTSTYETMKNNGLDLITKDSLRLNIIELHDVHYKAFNGLIKDVGLGLFNNDVLPISNKFLLLNERIKSPEYMYFLKSRISWKKDAINNSQLNKSQTEVLIEQIENELKHLTNN